MNKSKSNLPPDDPKFEAFCVLGISYKKADITLREKYSLSVDDQKGLLSRAKSLNLSSLLIVSTCNRTEIYGWASSPIDLLGYFFTKKNSNPKELVSLCYQNKGIKAIHHFFQVVCGLDSQIFGDFEIAGQIKAALTRSQKYQLIDAPMERMINFALKAGKRIKNETAVSLGSTSVSYVAVQYIIARVNFSQEQKILLIGTGKIGSNTIASLVKHGAKKVTVINRTDKRAETIAKNFHNVIPKRFDELEKELANTDILIVASNSTHPIITKDHLPNKNKAMVVLDLSVPRNVAKDVTDLEGISLVNVDELSQSVGETLNKRKEDLPKAINIIDQEIGEYQKWFAKRKWTPALKEFKQRLIEIQSKEIDYHNRKLEDFNQEHALQFSKRLMAKATTQFAHLLFQTRCECKEDAENRM